MGVLRRVLHIVLVEIRCVGTVGMGRPGVHCMSGHILVRRFWLCWRIGIALVGRKIAARLSGVDIVKTAVALILLISIACRTSRAKACAGSCGQSKCSVFDGVVELLLQTLQGALFFNVCSVVHRGRVGAWDIFEKTSLSERGWVFLRTGLRTQADAVPHCKAFGSNRGARL